jgi:hypothetical protein
MSTARRNRKDHLEQRYLGVWRCRFQYTPKMRESAMLEADLRAILAEQGKTFWPSEIERSLDTTDYDEAGGAPVLPRAIGDLPPSQAPH